MNLSVLLKEIWALIWKGRLLILYKQIVWEQRFDMEFFHPLFAHTAFDCVNALVQILKLTPRVNSRSCL